MAKELPYFKFEPSAWDNGNIQLCSKESKGLFIDICSIYWSRLGELPYALALQKHCNGNASALQELCNNDIITVENGNIVIDFLDEQLNEFQETSKKRTLAAKKRWDSNASALQMQSKSNAIREEKRREEKKKGDNILLKKESKKIQKKINVVDSRTFEERRNQFRESLREFEAEFTTKMVEDFFLYWGEKTIDGKKMRFEIQKTFEPKLRLTRWRNNNFEKQKNQNGSGKKSVDDAIREFFSE